MVETYFKTLQDSKQIFCLDCVVSLMKCLSTNALRRYTHDLDYNNEIIL